jgi:hypothetical protein
VVGTNDSQPAPSVMAGGQVRQQYERFANEDWSAETPDDSGYWLQRYMFHADARVFRRIRLYGELKSGIEVGRAGGPRPADEDTLDVHQAFVDVTAGAVTLRLGRQELAFGTQRLVSVREGPNIRQTFDGASLVLLRQRWRVDGFGVRYVSTETGAFDDSPDTGRALWGAYAVGWLDQARTRGVDLYYFGYRRKVATFDQGQSRELRHSWGARLWKTPGALDYNFEAVAQTGSFGATTIRAWTFASDTGFTLAAPGRPRLALRADITSGDHDRNDDRLGTFNPLFPRGAYFGLIASAGPMNHMDLHPQVTTHAGGNVEVTASWLFFWRQQLDDGIYGIPGNLLRSGEGTRSRFVGHSPGVEAEYRLNDHLSLTGNVALFTAGPFIRESSHARNIGFVAGWATYRF